VKIAKASQIIVSLGDIDARITADHTYGRRYNGGEAKLPGDAAPKPGRDVAAGAAELCAACGSPLWLGSWKPVHAFSEPAVLSSLGCADLRGTSRCQATGAEQTPITYARLVVAQGSPWALVTNLESVAMAYMEDAHVGRPGRPCQLRAARSK
jgi:hypothetical protein